MMSRGTGNYYTAFDNQVATSSSSSSRSLAAAYLSGQTERERTRLRPKVPEAISTKPTYLKGNMPPPEVQRVPRPPMELPSGEADQTPHKPPPLPNKKRINQSLYARHKEKFVSDVLSLPEFVDEYSKQLPVQIKVLRGYCGPSTRLTISTDDMFNVHLVKHTKVVRLSDSHGTIYSVPLNSSIEFGLVYDPIENSRGSSEALTGFKLRVSDMMKLTDLPKVVCCLKPWTSEDGKTVLTECEKLIVKGVLKVRMKSKKMLKVFSLRTKEEILLAEDCNALFSTQSTLVKMVLADLLEHVHKPIPCGAMIHFNAEIYQNPATSKKVHDIPDILVSRMIDLTEVIVETSLIASNIIDDIPAAYLAECSEEELHQMVDIPLEGGLLDVEVAVVEPKSDSERLYEDTRSIYEMFTPLKLKPLRNLTCDRAAAAQFVFSTAVRTGWETHGVELDEPAYTYLDFATLRSQKAKLSSGKEDGRGLKEGGQSSSSTRRNSDGQKMHAPKLPPRKAPPPYKDSTPTIRNAPPPSRNAEDKASRETEETEKSSLSLPRGFKTKEPQKEFVGNASPLSLPRDRQEDSLLDGSLSSSIGGSFEDNVFLDTKYSSDEAGLRQRLAEMEERLAKMETSLTALQKGRNDSSFNNRLKVVEEEVKKLRVGKLAPPPPSATPLATPSPSEDTVWGCSADKNREYLKKMTFRHILDLLEAMELSKYAEMFKREQVAGDILLELTDKELKEDLGIESKLHRVRLLKVINCQHSAKSILAGVDPYS